MGKKAKNNAHGVKTKAGMLLSGFIKEIAKEKTEFIKDDYNEDRMATKAEALARLIWKKALGFTDTVVKTDKNGVRKTVDVCHEPDRVMIGLLFDRMEGRAPLLVGDRDGKIMIADRVSNEGKNRINSVIEGRKK